MAKNATVAAAAVQSTVAQSAATPSVAELIAARIKQKSAVQRHVTTDGNDWACYFDHVRVDGRSTLEDVPCVTIRGIQRAKPGKNGEFFDHHAMLTEERALDLIADLTLAVEMVRYRKQRREQMAQTPAKPAKKAEKAATSENGDNLPF